MGSSVNSLKKEEVYKLAREMKSFLKIIEGTSIEAEDKGKLYEIETQKRKLEQMLFKFEPTIYEEYSMKTKYAYQNMISKRKEYDRLVKEECYSEMIQAAKENYERSTYEYEELKKYRNKLKTAISNN